jgi:peptidoglycan/LPS O-acetylase OafA/YrhL
MASKFGWNAVIFATVLIEMGLRIWCSFLLMHNVKYPQMIVGSPFFFVFSWAIGARVCEIHLAHEKTRVRLWVPFTLLVVGVGSQFVKPLSVFSFTLFALSTAIFMLCANLPKRCPQIFNWCVSLGLISYSFYLYHVPIIVLVRRLVGVWYPGHPFICFWILVAIVTPLYKLSLFLRNLIEVPSVSAGYHVLKFKREVAR